MIMVKCLPEIEYFTVFLKNRNLISKIGRSKVTDYAALKALKGNNTISGSSARIKLHFFYSEGLAY